MDVEFAIYGSWWFRSVELLMVLSSRPSEWRFSDENRPETYTPYLSDIGVMNSVIGCLRAALNLEACFFGAWDAYSVFGLRF